jgi:4-amino-4-deoxy-L-arabinose transferase-like glycosyltransferase
VAVRLVQSLLGALICVLVFRLAKLVLPRQAAILAAAISVLNGALLFTPALEARETLLTFLLLISVYYPLKHLPERTARWDIAAGALFGLLGLVKTIVTPVACVLAYMRLRSAQRRWLSAALIPTLALLILSTKALVNRPLNIPVGRSGTEYAAMAYFAGNHPFTHGEQWFNLTQEQYAQLRSMGFRVGEHAGEAGEVAQWKQRYPRIAYCDRTTFETNTLTLLRYNLSRPARLLALMAHNAVAFLLGPLHHHQVFDTVYLLNESVFSTLSRILWLAIAGVGWRSVWRVTPPGSQARNAVIYISLVITYFLVVYTLMIGSTIYSIPIIPFLVILQASGIYEIASLVRKGKRDNVLVPPVMLEPTSKKEEVYV